MLRTFLPIVFLLTAPVAADAPGCDVNYRVRPATTGFTATIDIANTGDVTINGWTLHFTLPPGQRILRGYEATFTETADGVLAQNAPHNGVLPPRATVRVGFLGSGQVLGGGVPDAFTVNGTTCT